MINHNVLKTITKLQLIIFKKKYLVSTKIFSQFFFYFTITYINKITSLFLFTLICVVFCVLN